MGLSGGSVGQESTFDALDAGDLGPIHGSVRSLAGGPGNPQPQENLMDRGAWEATVRRVAKSQTQLKQLSTAHMCKTLPSEPNLVRS